MDGETMGEARAFDMTGMAKAWKEGYLRGLEACLQSQVEGERLVKNAVKQGFSVPRQWVSSYKQWMDTPWDQINAVPVPLLAFSRQYSQAVNDAVEPLLKTSEAVWENAFGYYETAVAAPFRKYLRDTNKQVIDSIILD